MHPVDDACRAGPYTVACKLACLNAQPVRTLLSRVFGRLSQRLASERHANGSPTSMNARWLETYATQIDEVTAIGSEILTRSLVSQLGDFASWISNDECLRYCPECLEVGFQSALHQISAIVRCPIHGCDLLTTCRRCGASTSRYTVFDAFDLKLHCSTCREPLSHAWHRDGHVVCWECPAGHEAISEAKCKLRAFQRIVFAHHDGCHRHFSKLPEESIRVAYFALGNAAIGPTISEDLLDPRAVSARPLVVSAKPPEPSAFRPGGRPCNELTSAYFAVNEMLQTSIGKYRIARLMHLPGATSGRGVHERITVDIDDPEAFAFALWRFRSDAGMPHLCAEPGRIRTSYALGSRSHTLSLINWMRFLYLTFDAELHLATSWCRLSASTKRDPERGQHLREHFSGFFQLSAYPSPPAVTKAIVLPSPQQRYDPSYVYSVECHLAFWDASTIFPIESASWLSDLVE